MTTRIELLKELVAVVQAKVKGGGTATWWETIAGFNSHCIADAYCDDCRKDGSCEEYRVTDLKPRA